jgi:hypothetical protein
MVESDPAWAACDHTGTMERVTPGPTCGACGRKLDTNVWTRERLISGALADASGRDLDGGVIGVAQVVPDATIKEILDLTFPDADDRAAFLRAEREYRGGVWDEDETAASWAGEE